MVEEHCTLADTDREYVIAKLREQELELKAAGIVHLRLHGSLAPRRGDRDFRCGSDRRIRHHETSVPARYGRP